MDVLEVPYHLGRLVYPISECGHEHTDRLGRWSTGRVDNKGKAILVNWFLKRTQNPLIWVESAGK